MKVIAQGESNVATVLVVTRVIGVGDPVGDGLGEGEGEGLGLGEGVAVGAGAGEDPLPQAASVSSIANGNARWPIIVLLRV